MFFFVKVKTGSKKINNKIIKAKALRSVNKNFFNQETGGSVNRYT